MNRPIAESVAAPVEVTEKETPDPKPAPWWLTLAMMGGQTLLANRSAPVVPPMVAETPAPEPAAPAEPMPPARLVVRRRNLTSAEDLTKQLFRVKEVDLAHGTTPSTLLATNLRVASEAKFTANKIPHPLPTAITRREELRELPYQMGMDCHLDHDAAVNLQALSRKLRSILSEAANPVLVAQKAMQLRQGGNAPAIGAGGGFAGLAPALAGDPRPDPAYVRWHLFENPADLRQDWLQKEAVPALTQMLQAEGRPLREILVEALTRIDGPEATRALAQRAAFDLDAGVREQAIRALADRPRLPARQLFLEALSHPWSPAADFASEALVALEDRGSVPALVELVEAPDPLAPFVHGTSHDTRPRVRELVRINPVRNCLLCHAASTRTADMVRAVVPDPQQPLPPSFTPAYYDSHAQNRLFVRADVTYLRQDFAVPQLVARPGPWPAFQRYDYLVRTRPLFVGERPWPTNQPSPQRQAALVALRELTGPDAPNPAAIRPAGLAPVPVASHTQGMIDLRDGETR